jgi:hypothetical protein
MRLFHFRHVIITQGSSAGERSATRGNSSCKILDLLDLVSSCLLFIGKPWTSEDAAFEQQRSCSEEVRNSGHHLPIYRLNHELGQNKSDKNEHHERA